MTQRIDREITCAESAAAEICARASVVAPDSAAGEFMYAAGGRQTIRAFLNRTKPIQFEVEVNAKSAEALNEQHRLLCARSEHKPYFDFNHDDEAASFWPQEYAWKETPKPGVYCKGEWSGPGKAAIEGKAFRTFSGVFHVDNENGKPAHIICNPNARLNMGGFVNTPGFRDNLPLFAKNPGEEPTTTDTDPMNKIAELQTKLSQLETKIAELSAKSGDAAASADLKVAQADKRVVQLEISAAQSEEENTRLKADIKTRNAATAKSAVEAAVKRGALPPQNKEIQAKWQTEIENDPTRVKLLEAMNGNPALADKGFTTDSRPGHELTAKEGETRTLKGIAEITAKSSKIRFSVETTREKRRLGDDVARIYRREISGKNFAGYIGAIAQTLREMSAADPTDANVGILSGTLVAQRTLELFRLRLPMIKRMTTDFSEMPANLNQVIDTRIVVVPPTMTYNPAADPDSGQPVGWGIQTAAQTTDVTFKMDTLLGVPIRFTLDVLSETIRRLFDEQAPAASYAIAKYFVEKAYALMTPANFNAYAAVNGAKVPVAYATYAKAQVDFGRSSLVDLKTIFDPNEVPPENRTVLLNAAYNGQLAKDPSIVNFYAGQQDPEIITEAALPMLAGFQPMEAPNLANNNATANLAGFAMQRNAIVLATRLPTDLNQILPGASFGSVTTVTEEDTGLAMQLVQHVNQEAGYAEWRLQVILGAGVGDKRAGLVCTTQ